MISPRESNPTVGKILPQLVNNTTADSTVFDVSKARQFELTLIVGATDTTVDAQVFSADDASKTNAAAIAGLSITQVASDGDGTIRLIVVRQPNMPSTQSFAFLRVTVGNGSTGANIAAVIKATEVRYEGAGEFEDSDVDEVVSV